jgi:thymidine phosphorylase
MAAHGKKFISIVSAHEGDAGDATALEKILDVYHAPIVQPFLAKSNGVIKNMDAGTIGRASVFLGGGRHKTDDEIDYAVGFSKIKKIGEMVVRNEPLFIVHARTEHSLNSVMPLLEKAIEVR